jgi:hypothetical protein
MTQTASTTSNLHIFLNELSLHGQYQNIQDFKQAILVFTNTLVAIKQHQNPRLPERALYRTQLLYTRSAINSEVFKASFNQIPDKGLQQRFRELVFNQGNAKDWQKQQRHSADATYTSEHEEDTPLQSNVTQTTLAEAAEYMLQGFMCLLVHFQASRYSSLLNITVIKNGQESIALKGVETSTEWEKWATSTFHLYDPQTQAKPSEEQTILHDISRFEATSRVQQGRRMYRERSTGDLWCLDNQHRYKGTHFEVFDRHGEHKGTATLDGVLDITKREKDRKI